jgi:hypothetical protein
MIPPIRMRLRPIECARPGYVGTERVTQLMETDPGFKRLTEKMGLERTDLNIERSRYPGSRR